MCLFINSHVCLYIIVGSLKVYNWLNKVIYRIFYFISEQRLLLVSGMKDALLANRLSIIWQRVALCFAFYIHNYFLEGTQMSLIYYIYL